MGIRKGKETRSQTYQPMVGQELDHLKFPHNISDCSPDKLNNQTQELKHKNTHTGLYEEEKEEGDFHRVLFNGTNENHQDFH